MSTVEFITVLFFEVDEQLRAIPKHPEAHLWPSEVVTLGLLHALNRASGFRLLSLQSEPRSAVRCASDVSTDATPGDCVPTPPRPIPYGRGPVHGPKTAASRDVLSSPRTPTRSSASAAGRPLWRLRSPSRLDAQG